MDKNQPEELLLNFIKTQLQKKQNIVVREKRKIDLEIKGLEETVLKLRKFEKKHIEELREIYEFSIYGCDLFKTYLFTPINEIEEIIRYTQLQGNDYYRNTLPDEEAWLFYSSFDSILLQYAFLEKELGLSQTTAKKYLNILKEKNLIESKRVMGGIEYKLKEKK